MVFWSGSSPAGCILIRVTMTLSVMSDSLSITVISYYVWCTIDGFEELDMDMVMIIFS
jgi:hypothetical protein